MISLEQLTFSQILKIPVNKLHLSLSPNHQKEILRLKQRLRAYNISWRPHIWFADEWFSPNGIGGFALPLSLGHKKLITLEKKYLGHLEGTSSKEFFKLACHETGHALDNAYKLRLSKGRQKIFGKTSQHYPKSYIPNPNRNDHVHFLGDFYAQAHPDEDWAETVGFLLYNNKSWNKNYLNTYAWQKLCFAHALLNQLQHKTPKLTRHLKPYHVQNDERTFLQYLEDKSHQLKPNKKPFFLTEKHVQIIKSQKPSKLSNHAVITNRLISKNKNLLISKIEKNTNISPWYIEKGLLTLKKECKENAYQLQFLQRPSLKKIEEIITSQLEEFINKGHARIYM